LGAAVLVVQIEKVSGGFVVQIGKVSGGFVVQIKRREQWF
jgi:hypothetical protein